LAFKDWSVTPGSNVSIGGKSIAENCDPGNLNDAIRQVMADLKASLGGTVSVTDYGVKADGVTDDTVAFQAAVTAAQAVGGQLSLPNGKIRLTAPIVISKGMSIVGLSPRVNNNNVLIYQGSWLYFDHTGIGLSFNTSGVYSTDFDLVDFGTVRNQPAPAGGWTPTAHNFDINILSTQDVRIEGLILLNPTKGINMSGGGRLLVRDLRGQPFQIGVQIDNVLDVCRIEDVHFWPFWKDDANLQSYTQQNLDSIYSLRSDNPEICNVFSLYCRSIIRFGQSASGVTRRAHIGDLDADTCKDGIWVDSTVTSGVTAHIDELTHLAINTALGGAAVRIEGNNSFIRIDDLQSGNSRNNAINIGGTGNIVKIAHTLIEGYDLAGLNDPAITVSSGNFLYLLGDPTMALGVGTGTGGPYGGTGFISKTSTNGYDAGAGGAVTQITSRTTGVTLNKPCGAITLVSAAGSASWQSFTVTNSKVAANDTISVSQKSGTDLYMIQVTNVAAGSFKISFATTGGTTTEQPVFNFTVRKGGIA
jgi:hypothetical protein